MTKNGTNKVLYPVLVALIVVIVCGVFGGYVQVSANTRAVKRLEKRSEVIDAVQLDVREILTRVKRLEKDADKKDDR